MDTDFLFQRLHTLKQFSTVGFYLKQFNLLKSLVEERYPYIDEAYFVTCCINGLKEEIRNVVQLFRPVTVSDVLSLAEFKESILAVEAKMNASNSKELLHERSVLADRVEECCSSPPTLEETLSNQPVTVSAIQASSEFCDQSVGEESVMNDDDHKSASVEESMDLLGVTSKENKCCFVDFDKGLISADSSEFPETVTVLEHSEFSSSKESTTTIVHTAPTVTNMYNTIPFRVMARVLSVTVTKDVPEYMDILAASIIDRNIQGIELFDPGISCIRYETFGRQGYKEASSMFTFLGVIRVLMCSYFGACMLMECMYARSGIQQNLVVRIDDWVETKNCYKVLSDRPQHTYVHGQHGAQFLNMVLPLGILCMGEMQENAPSDSGCSRLIKCIYFDPGIRCIFLGTMTTSLDIFIPTIIVHRCSNGNYVGQKHVGATGMQYNLYLFRNMNLYSAHIQWNYMCSLYVLEVLNTGCECTSHLELLMNIKNLSVPFQKAYVKKMWSARTTFLKTDQLVHEDDHANVYELPIAKSFWLDGIHVLASVHPVEVQFKVQDSTLHEAVQMSMSPGGNHNNKHLSFVGLKYIMDVADTCRNNEVMLHNALIYSLLKGECGTKFYQLYEKEKLDIGVPAMTPLFWNSCRNNICLMWKNQLLLVLLCKGCLDYMDRLSGAESLLRSIWRIAWTIHHDFVVIFVVRWCGQSYIIRYGSGVAHFIGLLVGTETACRNILFFIPGVGYVIFVVRMKSNLGQASSHVFPSQRGMPGHMASDSTWCYEIWYYTATKSILEYHVLFEQWYIQVTFPYVTFLYASEEVFLDVQTKVGLADVALKFFLIVGLFTSFKGQIADNLYVPSSKAYLNVSSEARQIQVARGNSNGALRCFKLKNFQNAAERYVLGYLLLHEILCTSSLMPLVLNKNWSNQIGVAYSDDSVVRECIWQTKHLEIIFRHIKASFLKIKGQYGGNKFFFFDGGLMVSHSVQSIHHFRHQVLFLSQMGQSRRAAVQGTYSGQFLVHYVVDDIWHYKWVHNVFMATIVSEVSLHSQYVPLLPGLIPYSDKAEIKGAHTIITISLLELSHSPEGSSLLETKNCAFSSRIAHIILSLVTKVIQPLLSPSMTDLAVGSLFGSFSTLFRSAIQYSRTCMCVVLVTVTSTNSCKSSLLTTTDMGNGLIFWFLPFFPFPLQIQMHTSRNAFISQQHSWYYDPVIVWVSKEYASRNHCVGVSVFESGLPSLMSATKRSVIQFKDSAQFLIPMIKFSSFLMLVGAGTLVALLWRIVWNSSFHYKITLTFILWYLTVRVIWQGASVQSGGPVHQFYISRLNGQCNLLLTHHGKWFFICAYYSLVFYHEDMV